MEAINLFAREIFQTYRRKAGKDADVYVFMRTQMPHLDFPKYKKMLWRHGLLAEIWGIIATKLSGDKIDYLRSWSQGSDK